MGLVLGFGCSVCVVWCVLKERRVLNSLRHRLWQRAKKCQEAVKQLTWQVLLLLSAVVNDTYPLIFFDQPLTRSQMSMCIILVCTFFIFPKCSHIFLCPAKQSKDVFKVLGFYWFSLYTEVALRENKLQLRVKRNKCAIHEPCFEWNSSNNFPKVTGKLWSLVIFLSERTRACSCNIKHVFLQCYLDTDFWFRTVFKCTLTNQACQYPGNRRWFIWCWFKCRFCVGCFAQSWL